MKVECNVCGTQYEDWFGSTPCCGSIAYVVDENGNKTNSIGIFASLDGDEIKPTIIYFGEK
jgi:NAD-dependent SIR2 family protein deacetylase